MKVRGVSVNQKSWGKGVGPADDDIAIVFPIARETASEARGPNIRVWTIEGPQIGCADLVMVVDLVVEADRVPGGYAGIRNQLKGIGPRSSLGGQWIEDIQ